MFKLSDYNKTKVLITGHTGFKGSWLAQMLISAGANVVGYSLKPTESQKLFNKLNLEKTMTSYFNDIRDLNKLTEVLKKEEPEFVFHLAAQPLVLDSYNNPVYTYETNVMGTVNICEAVRLSGCVKSFVNITTDKVYENKEWIWGYREDENLDGFDPYSNSKSCSELVTKSYIRCFFKSLNIPVSTARSGNVIGGGDFSENRILPDCIRAGTNKEDIILRNPSSIRPYQHVIEPLYAYLLIGMEQFKNHQFQGSYNIGPEITDCISTLTVAKEFCDSWGENLKYKVLDVAQSQHEANILKLDCTKLKTNSKWKSIWSAKEAITKTVEWTKCDIKCMNMIEITQAQINEYLKKIESDTI